MKDPYQVIKTVSVTEKGTSLIENNQYVFVVHPDANKVEIKSAIETLFERKVQAVNVINRKGKKRRNRFGVGKKPDVKKAIVTLREGEQPIEIF